MKSVMKIHYLQDNGETVSPNLCQKNERDDNDKQIHDSQRARPYPSGLRR